MSQKNVHQRIFENDFKDKILKSPQNSIINNSTFNNNINKIYCFNNEEKILISKIRSLIKCIKNEEIENNNKIMKKEKINKRFSLDTKLNNNNNILINHNKIKSDEIKKNNFSSRNSSFNNNIFIKKNSEINIEKNEKKLIKNFCFNEKNLITKEDYLQHCYKLLRNCNYKKVYFILQKYLKNFYYFSKEKIDEIIKLNEEISPEKILNNLNLVKKKILKINFNDHIKTMYLRENKYDNISNYIKIFKNNEKYLNKMDKILISKLIK